MKQSVIWGCIFLLSGCAQSYAPQPKQTEKNMWHPVESSSISFIRMHPNAAQKNGYVTWQMYEHETSGEKEWRIDGKAIGADGEKALADLISAVTANGIPSDGIYGCRYEANMPQYRLNFEHNGHAYSVLSSSNCQNGAPFNVFVDGAWQLHLSGTIGTALTAALSFTDVPLTVGQSAGMIMLDQPVDIRGYEKGTGKSPRVWFDDIFRKDASFEKFASDAVAVFGKMDMPRVACNQAKRADCSEILGQYTIRSGVITYPIALHYADGATTLSQPTPDKTQMETFKQAENAWSMQTYINMDSAPCQLSFETPTDCAMVRGLAKYMDAPENASCAMWRMSGGSRPAAVYYEGLDALWIASGSSADSFFKALCADKKRLSASSRSKLCGDTLTQTKGAMNIFLKSSGDVFIFVTQDGKTTIL